MIDFKFADLHCHPTLKTFGKSFDSSINGRKKADLWYQKKPNELNKFLQKLLGITKFSQTDFQTMEEANVRLAFVSFYPFEKGFFKNPYINNRIVALLANFITSIGFKRIRDIQNHLDYYRDLMAEYEFLITSLKNTYKDDTVSRWRILSHKESLENVLQDESRFSIIPTIEGAHVFNTGMSEFGRPLNFKDVLDTIEKLKKIKHPPFFMTFAHNFNNDLCGHAPSLQPLHPMVDQSEGIDQGITPLGFQVLRSLLNVQNGPRILIDIKHMSLRSRKEFFKFLDEEYDSLIPVIVSHGAVTGTDFSGNKHSSLIDNCFVPNSINFYDEEIVYIAKTNGLFAIQFDAKRLAPAKLIKKPLLGNNKKKALNKSTKIIFNQIIHVAEILDAHGYYSWGTTCIGSDFDGTIDPLNEVWTASDFKKMAHELYFLIEGYLLNKNSLKQSRNKNESAMVVINNFAINNAVKFVNSYYKRDVIDRQLSSVVKAF